MTVAELVKRLRLVLSDFGQYDSSSDDWETDDSECLWTNDELTQYLDEALIEYTLRFPILDATTPEVCSVDVIAGEPEYALHSSIYDIESVLLTGEDFRMEPTTLRRMEDINSWRNETGTPTIYWFDENERTLRIYPTPDAAGTLALTVSRGPLKSLCWEANNASPPIPAQDHRYLRYWALHLAYLKDDTEETYNEKRSMLHAARFEEQVGLTTTRHQSRVRAETIGYSRVRSYY